MANDPKMIKPIPSSYWVLPGRFLAGSYPGSTSGVQSETRQVLKRFLELGITSFFNLTQPGELPSYQELLLQETSAIKVSVECHSFPIPDLGLPTQVQMRELLSKIDASLANGKRIYLHCWGGMVLVAKNGRLKRLSFPTGPRRFTNTMKGPANT